MDYISSKNASLLAHEDIYLSHLGSIGAKVRAPHYFPAQKESVLENMVSFPEPDEQEFRELLSYLEFFATAVWSIPEDAPEHPRQLVILARGKIPAAQLLPPLRQAARDTLDAVETFCPERIAAIDEDCARHNILTLSDVKARYGHR